jgi:pSer/pThr/pTyr-binding forkhead associated (FHA) protein
MLKLILRFQDTTLQEYNFDKTPVVIGRRDDNDIIIDNMAVSGHHCRIDLEEPNFFVITDEDSLNGTFVNEKKITHERIFDGDVITIGKHSLELIDTRPESERPAKPMEDKEPAAKGAFRDTVVLDTQAQQELLAKQAGEKGGTQEEAQRPKRVQLFGTITIISGGTPQIIDLNKNLTKLGRGDDVDIKCSGFLVGKTAAIINKRPNGFYIAYAEGLKKPEVNREQVSTQKQLKDGDEIIIGSTRMTFSLWEEIS